MKIFGFLFSGKFMGILLVIFAISIGYATFIENDFDAKTARLLIYNAWWFEAILVLMVMNFSGMIFTKKLYRIGKLNILVMHTAFIIIIIGAGVTRYFGFEGQMHIRNGESSNRIRSYDDYVNVSIRDNEYYKRIYDKIILAPVNKNLYTKEIHLNGKNIKLEIESFRPNMQKTLHPDPAGDRYLNLMTASMHGRRNLLLKEMDKDIVEGIVFSFGDTTSNEMVQFIQIDSVVMVRSPYSIQLSHRGVQVGEPLEANTFHTVSSMQVYQIQNVSFVFMEVSDKSRVVYMPARDGSSEGENLVDLKVTVDEAEEHYMIKQGVFEQLVINNILFTMNIGNQLYTIPFELKLNSFELERYPGSESPSSFASDITLIDEHAGIEQPFRIFMNNVLDYKGYRFYQSSYDSDEQGTVLSVNHDHWGTLITYTGYFLLFASLIISLFTRNTRFSRLTRQMNELHSQRKRMTLSVIFLISFTFTAGMTKVQAADNDVDPEFSAAFGKMLVQSKDGRVHPLNTIATNSLVKIYKKSRYEDRNADQVFLEMLLKPEKWKNKPMIKIYEPEVQELIGIEDNFACFNDFLDEKGKYKLRSRVDEIYAKSPALRSKIDKEIVNVDERFNVSNMVFNGSLLKIYPIPDDPDNKWVSPADIRMRDSLNNRITYFEYLINTINEGIATGNYTQAYSILSEISQNQQKYGKDIIPNPSKIQMEIQYNKLSIFRRLFPVYMMAGIALLGIFLVQLFKPQLEFRKVIKIAYTILMIAFIFQTAGLIIRWYVSGHAPWSNGYESMIYIAWATMLAGFVFYRKSPITLSVTTILAGITLLTAHMSWLNPEITNLVPVLKSYWLTIHVATITASYGFFGMASMLGILDLGIMIFRNKDNHERINLKLKELTIIIEMSLMVGLILLVIGNFLGGVWANESWGRYWGWDPKETWSLVTIIVYTFILHMRLIPGMRSLFSINFMAHIGFGAVLMTYFGVNYYLSGLHSYAQGDPVPVPSFIYYMVAVISIISVLAIINDINLKNKLEVKGELENDD